jgi:signal transduction histidine kinase/ActR/RegA family two-component response regulator
VLCLPIVKQTEVVGLLYLENDLLADAFTPDRLAALSMLATQAAISLENARLLAQERNARVAAEEAERRAAFLADVSALLAEELDEHVALARVARMCVRSAVDACLIDLLEAGGRIRRVTVAHRDAAQERGMAEVARTYPPTMDSPHASSQAVRTRGLVLIRDVAEEVSRITVDPRHASVLQSFGVAAIAAMPLLARGRVLGALVVGSNAPEGPPLDLLGEVARRLATAIDNTQLIAAEREARVAAERAEAITRSRDQLQAANAALERASRAKDEFLASMSHELRTPLNGILGTTEVIDAEVYGPLGKDLRAAVGRIEESGRHLLSLINDILDIAKVGAGKLELELSPVAVEALCRASLRLVDSPARRKRIGLQLVCGLDLPTILADERRLKQVLVNLLTNAVKFTPEGGKVGVELDVIDDGETVEIVVWDTGIGIAAEDLPRLFQPFVQLDAALSRHHAGTGLGLALVRQMTELHGGTVRVESEVGRGSRFTVTLPVKEATQAAPASLPLPPVLAGAASTPRLVLLADDDPTNIPAVFDMLAARGHDVRVATNGAEAIQMAHELHPDVVLLDVQMPVIDGLTAMRQLRASPDTRDEPIIAVTALAMPGDRERCLEAGADEYLSKPVSIRALVAAIERLCARAPRRPPPSGGGRDDP